MEEKIKQEILRLYGDKISSVKFAGRRIDNPSVKLEGGEIIEGTYRYDFSITFKNNVSRIVDFRSVAQVNSAIGNLIEKLKI